MAGNNGPKIVRSTLVLALDAADKKSYSGSGTSWKDLSGSQFDGTLTNGPSFSPTNGGVIVFDGVNDYTQISVTSGLGSGAFSIEFWYYKLADSGMIFNSRGGGTGSDGIDITFNFGITTANYVLLNAVGAGVLNLNRWNHVVITRSTSSDWARYINKTLNGTYSGLLAGAGNDFSNTTFLLGGSTAGNTGYLNGYISIFRLYRKQLSETEIIQNYETLRGRFNL